MRISCTETPIQQIKENKRKREWDYNLSKAASGITGFVDKSWAGKMRIGIPSPLRTLPRAQDKLHNIKVVNSWILTLSCCCNFFTFLAFSPFSCNKKKTRWDKQNSWRNSSLSHVNLLSARLPMRAPKRRHLVRLSSSIGSKTPKFVSVKNEVFLSQLIVYLHAEAEMSKYSWLRYLRPKPLTCSFFALVSASKEAWMLSCWRLKFFL